MTENEKAKVIEKIQGLFALAENNPSEEEAQSALATARRLLLKYNLTEDEVDTVESDSKGGSNVVTLKTTRIHDWIEQLGHLVCEYFDAKFFLRRGSPKFKMPSSFTFYGMKINANSAVYVFESLFNQVQKLAKKYKPRKYDFDQQSYYTNFAIYSVQARREYREGLVSGFRAKIHEIKQNEEQEFGKQKITALVVRHEEVAKNWLAENDIKIKNESSVSQSFGTNTGSYFKGKIDSKNLSIAKGIKGGSK